MDFLKMYTNNRFYLRTIRPAIIFDAFYTKNEKNRSPLLGEIGDCLNLFEIQ